MIAHLMVFGDDGELFPLPVADADDDAIRDAIDIIEQRIVRERAEVVELKALLRARGAVEPSAEEVRAESQRHATAGILDLAA